MVFFLILLFFPSPVFSPNINSKADVLLFMTLPIISGCLAREGSRLASLRALALILAVFGHVVGWNVASWKKDRKTGLIIFAVRVPSLRRSFNGLIGIFFVLKCKVH